MSAREVFKLDCACGHTLTIPTCYVIAVCPHCKAQFTIDWAALARECRQAAGVE